MINYVMNCNKRCEEILVMINALKNLFFYLQLELSREESRKDWKVGKMGKLEDGKSTF